MSKFLLCTFLAYDGETPVYLDAERVVSGKCAASVSVESMKGSKVKFHPETITYTGVTVGGVHTGGFNRTEAHYTVSSTSSDKGKLEFEVDDERDHWSGHWNSLRLPQAAAEFARNNGLQEYVSESGVLKFVREEPSMAWVEQMEKLRYDDVKTREDLYNTMLEGYYSYSECKELAKFLTGVFAGQYLSDQEKLQWVREMSESTNPKYWYAAKSLLQSTFVDMKESTELCCELEKKLEGVPMYTLGKKVYFDKGEYEQEKLKNDQSNREAWRYLAPRVGAIIAFLLCCFAFIEC